MKDADALHIAGIPDSLLERERDLRLEIAFFEKRQQELRDSLHQNADSARIATGGVLLDRKNRHEALVRFFEEKYPDYHRAKYGLATTGVAEVQQMLRPGQTLLEYTVGDSVIFAFIVRPDHFSVHTMPRDFPLEQTVDSLTRLGIYAYYTLPKAKRTQTIEKNSVRNYTNAARLLYDKLVAPVAEHLGEELIIVPDGVLGYVPFEALLTGEPARRSVFSTYEPHFLLQRHRLSYGASATLLREMRDRQHRTDPQSTVLALAPFFREDTAALRFRADSADLFALRDVFGPLRASGDEAYAVTQLLGGSALYGSEASLDAFRRLAPEYRVLHLSTHGKADDRAGDYAFLALGVPGDTSTFDKLYARDLYGIGLNADLVVLSACETATGKLRRGEGIVSLARAFSFAGAKSLVTSLWKVNDSATKNLLVDFYRHLHEGRSKDAALRQAKLDFLKNNRDVDANLLHPFFWAGFVAVGDMQPLK
jgi:CHAT domain-containing protein